MTEWRGWFPKQRHATDHPLPIYAEAPFATRRPPAISIARLFAHPRSPSGDGLETLNGEAPDSSFLARGSVSFLQADLQQLVEGIEVGDLAEPKFTAGQAVYGLQPHGPLNMCTFLMSFQ